MTMSPNLKPLLLPQLVEARDQRRRWELQQTSPSAECDLSYVFYTTNSSSSDITSPVTPTFSAKGHFRFSSSTSSLDLPPQLLQDSPVSPTQTSHSKNAATKRLLPDVQEEPMEPDDDSSLDHFGLYSCLCDEPCQHRDSSEGTFFHGNIVSDYDIDDYDVGFLSDGDVSVDARSTKKSRSGSESPLAGLTSRIGARLPGVRRWKSTSRRHGPNPILSPATELSLESVVLSGAPSSRSSSMSAPSRQMPTNEPSVLATPALSFYESTESVNRIPAPIDIELANGDRRGSVQRERELATTPLLPPLLTSSICQPPPESPLQPPTVASSPATEVHSPVHSPPPSITSFPRPSLSTKPSISSFRLGPQSPDLPIPLPSILQESDEWSDRLGHANFTITPLPYQPENVNLEALRQLRGDWDAARVNYTKHLVRTGDNYGQTSKIYALTEAKWAETEKRWKSIHEELMEQIVSVTKSAPPSTIDSRSRSRTRGRGRSASGSSAFLGRPPADDVFAGMQWRRLEDGQPSAIPRMLEAAGKFPARGDEDIVGPMQRDEVMVRAHSEERKGGRFWKNLAGKVGLRK